MHVLSPEQALSPPLLCMFRRVFRTRRRRSRPERRGRRRGISFRLEAAEGQRPRARVTLPVVAAARARTPAVVPLRAGEAAAAAGGGAGGLASVGSDSKAKVWGLERDPEGTPQLFKCGPDHKLVFTLGDHVITHHVKAHRMKVDAQDNAWIMDEASA